MKRSFFFYNFMMITLPMLLVLFLLGLMAVVITMDGSRKTIETINEQTIGRIRESTELMFSEADAQSLNYSTSPSVMLRLEDLLQNGYADKEYMDISNMIRTFLDSNVNSKTFLHSIYIYLENDKRNFFASSIGLTDPLHFQDVSWLDEVSSQSPDINQWLAIRSVGLYSFSSRARDVISLYKRLFSSSRLKPIGVLVVNIRTNYLKSFYQHYLNYPGQAILLLKNDGTILCGTGMIENSSRLPDAEDLNAAYFVSQEASDVYGLIYLSLVPKKVLLLQAEEKMRIVVSAIVLILVVGSIFAFFITRRNTQHLRNIVALLESAEKGEELPAIRPSGDIYGYITQNIIKTFLEKKHALDTMHFSFLQSQLNPHFLVNTLKNIFWKTVRLTGQPNDASRMLDLLSGVLQYALADPERYVTVGDEIENTKKYLEISQMRFDHGFTVIWSCEGDMDEFRCIKFILQPLVENSIAHGLQDKERGIVSISILIQTEDIKFSIKDNGQGFSNERLRIILESFRQEVSPEKNIGLYNLNKRLILAYGKKSALNIISTPGLETEVSFVISKIASS